MNKVEIAVRVRQATELGRARGIAAASWVFDGNTDAATYSQFLAMDEAGDPAMHDAFGPSSGWLSGEFAEGPTPAELAHELGMPTDEESDWYAIDEACNAYEEAADEAYWAYLEITARQMLKD